MRQFEQGNLIAASAPLLQVFEALYHSPEVFVIMLNQVGGIITRGDLQKAPVRMWLFSLISLIEMQLLRLIREYYPDDSWKPLITSGRLAKAESQLANRQQRNTAIDLADCLQFCDKRDIVLQTDKLQQLIPLNPNSKMLLKDLENLRNELAHAQDIIAGRWPDIASLVTKAEDFLKKCEAIP